jgi:hypothetical protein
MIAQQERRHQTLEPAVQLAFRFGFRRFARRCAGE